MDMERAMEFIVENLAKVAAAQQQAEVRGARADRRIHGLQTLMKLGMKRLAKIEQGIAAQQKRTDARFAEVARHEGRTDAMFVEVAATLKELAEQQKEQAAQHKRTDQKFERWLDSLQGGNGHKKRRPS
jgi:hypothetical protein